MDPVSLAEFTCDRCGFGGTVRDSLCGLSSVSAPEHPTPEFRARSCAPANGHEERRWPQRSRIASTFSPL